MLVGILLYVFENAGPFICIESFYNPHLTPQRTGLVVLVVLCCICGENAHFPFHTWQPDTYEQSPTATTMILKWCHGEDGCFWHYPLVDTRFPVASWAWGDTVSILCVTGMIYASLLAMRQDDLKRLIAYSSIAHIGLMCLAIFANSQSGMQGVMIQMFNHGINIIGLWIVVELIERQFGTRKMSELGGVAQKSPVLAIMLVIVSLANVALPLTNAFIGEFLCLMVYSLPLFKIQYRFCCTAASGDNYSFGGLYFEMIQKVLFGNTRCIRQTGQDLNVNEKFALSIIVVSILVIGVYPKPFMELTQGMCRYDTIKHNYQTSLGEEYNYEPNFNFCSLGRGNDV